MDVNNTDILHTGVAHDENPPGRGSGRFAWGSGENPGQHRFDLLSEVEKLRNRNYSDDEIAKMLIGPNSKASELKQILNASISISTEQVKKLRAQGKTEKEIAQILLGRTATVNDLKAKIAIADKRERMAMVNKVTELYSKTITADKPEGNKSEVARQLGINESAVRSYLNEARASNMNKYWNTADKLKDAISKSETGIIDVSKYTEISLGVTENTKKIAIALLQEEGYVKTWVQIPQMGTGEKTSMMVLCAPPKDGETVKDVLQKAQKEKFNVSTIVDYSPDGGSTFFSPEQPTSMSSDRIYLRTPENGGKDKDGVIEIRRGVKDLSLGNSQYAQVRIAVDNTHYMKGMAIYSDDIPEGYDIVYNSSKPDSWPLKGPDKDKEVLKRLKDDPDNPFGATIKAGGQSYYADPKGIYVKDGNGYKKAKKNDTGERYSLSPINKINEEGDWDTWSRTLSSQFLSKQPLKLINQQLDLTIKSKKSELDDILSLTNPVIKKQLLGDFAEQCDKQASKLSADGIKGQAFQVLLPVTKMKENEIYAQNFTNGDVVALVRYPHSGTFEIPLLTVNNKNPDAKKILGSARDAVGINPKVAAILSGADFDGDTALVIPVKSNNLSIQSRKPLKGLIDWDFHEIYRLPDGIDPPTDKIKQTKMGEVTNLIMDMTLQGATDDELEKAVKHSMVVIDMVKHRLDYKQSEKDNDIIALKKKYQGVNPNGTPKGASTIITKAKSETRVFKRKEVVRESEMTPEELKAFKAGKKVYRSISNELAKSIVNDPPEVYKEKIAKELGIAKGSVDSYISNMVRVKDPDKMTAEERERYDKGYKIYRTTPPSRKQEKVSKMYTVDDARQLMRDPNDKKELAYAAYANTLKDLADQARVAYRSLKPSKVDPIAKTAYATEVRSLNDRLKEAQSNAPKERKAQALANKVVAQKIKSNPSLEEDHEHLGREKNRALNAARVAVGAHKDPIYISDREWAAIQSNALSSSTVEKILLNSDKDRFRELATPRNTSTLPKSKIDLARSMIASGMYTNKEIADKLGISTSTLYKYLNE